jgi:hypothetical protein
MGPGLGIDLTTTGNFCFVFICRDSSICSNATSTNFIAASETGDPTVEFEVWAILRQTKTTSVSGPQNSTCTMSASKRVPTGWVQASNSALAGRQGRAVVFRYPPPPNGPDTTAGANSVKFGWIEGMSYTHALTP